MGYLRFIAQRLGLALVTLWGLATLVFIMIKLIPGDEAQMAAGAGAGPEQVARVAERLGLDAPAYIQYFRFLGRLVVGDLGTSIISSRPVMADLAQVLPSTIELMVVSTILGLLLAFPAAMLAAAHRDRTFDLSSRVTAILAAGLPTFWLALMLQFLFGSLWRLTPISGQNSFGMAAPVVTGMPTVDALLAGNLPAFADSVRYLILPAVVFAIPFACQVYRVLRASLVATLASDMILPVRAKGGSLRRIVLRHALPNALPPTLNLIGNLFGGMIGGAILVEVVFARRGVGTYIASAIAQKDTFAVLGTVMFVGISVCLVNIVTDIVVLLLDPRLRSEISTQGA